MSLRLRAQVRTSWWGPTPVPTPQRRGQTAPGPPESRWLRGDVGCTADRCRGATVSWLGIVHRIERPSSAWGEKSADRPCMASRRPHAVVCRRCALPSHASGVGCDASHSSWSTHPASAPARCRESEGRRPSAGMARGRPLAGRPTHHVGGQVRTRSATISRPVCLSRWRRLSCLFTSAHSGPVRTAACGPCPAVGHRGSPAA